MSISAFNAGELGKKTAYVDTYTPSLLHSIPRDLTRNEAGVDAEHMLGEDLWNGYEFSWINTDGKPLIAGIRIRVSAQSPALVESKSMKLYLMSFANTKFENRAEVMRTIDQDLAIAFRAPVMVELLDLSQMEVVQSSIAGRCLDNRDLRFNVYERTPDLLVAPDSDLLVRESLHTHLFRSLCPVTGQPDWASIAIDYWGQAIDEDGLLRYLVSYRNHPGFHETTVETIYADLMARYELNSLSVYGRFQRRGGLDINPFRSTDETDAPIYRMSRQ